MLAMDVVEASPRRRSARAYWLLALAIALGVLVALSLLLEGLRERHAEHVQASFSAETQRLTHTIDWRMKAYRQILRGAAGLFAASGNVSREEWRRYVEKLELEQAYQGIQGVGFTQYIPAAQLEAHVEAIRRQGFADYRVTPAGPREVYSSIVYIEPFSGRNLRAFGYDMFSEPVRQAAMTQARDTGSVAFSGKVHLVQETAADIQAGILAYYPVYANGTLPLTLEQRRAALVGWTYSPYRMRDLIEGMLQGDLALIRLEIFDGAQPSAESLLYDSQAGKPDPVEAPQLVLETSLDLAGHTWTLRYSALPGFAASTKYQAPWVEGAGLLLIGLLVLGLTWALFNTRRHAETLAEVLTRSLRESQEHFRAVFEQAAVGIVLQDPRSGRYLRVNHRFCELVGYSRAELEQMGCEDISHPDDIELGREQKRELSARAITHFTLEKRFRHRSGRTLWFTVTGSALSSLDDEVEYHLLVIEDITARKRSAAQLQLAASVFTHAREGIIVADTAGNIVDVNDAFTRVSGYTREQLLGNGTRMLKSGHHSADFYAALWQALHGQGHWSGEIWNRNANGSVYAALLTISAVCGVDGTPHHYVALFTDISTMKAHEATLVHMANYDALTSLPNRVLLADRLHHGMAQAERRGMLLAVVFIDLDGFKAINDRHGHDVGDALLIALALRMKDALRESDTLARIGGDEFVALLDLDDEEECQRILARLLRAAAAPVVVKESELHVSASIGVTLYPQDQSNAEQLMRHADQAMYEAKQTGRNRCCFFAPEKREEEMPET